MPAYIIVDVEITEKEGYEEYRSQVPATIAAYGGRFLVRGGALEVLEGTWSPKRCVILEFPSLEQAKAWYHSPEYKPLLALRERSATTNLILVEGVG